MPALWKYTVMAGIVVEIVIERSPDGLVGRFDRIGDSRRNDTSKHETSDVGWWWHRVA